MEPIVYEDPMIPDRLQAIITVLEVYHRDLVHINTSLSQDPLPSHRYLLGLLEKKGNYLLYWLKTRTLPKEVEGDEQFLKTVEALQRLIDPWNQTISTMSQSYVQDLFFNCPLTLTVTHCRRLRNESLTFSVE